jgi:hypothetical protein
VSLSLSSILFLNPHFSLSLLPHSVCTLCVCVCTYVHYLIIPVHHIGQCTSAYMYFPGSKGDLFSDFYHTNSPQKHCLCPDQSFFFFFFQPYLCPVGPSVSLQTKLKYKGVFIPLVYEMTIGCIGTPLTRVGRSFGSYLLAFTTSSYAL